MVVTPLYAAVLVLWFTLLSLHVVRRRRQTRVSLGDGGNHVLQRAIRAHANFAEYVPLALILLLVLELSRFSIYLLHAIGATLVLARLLHGYALAYRTSFRFGLVWGAGLTLIVLLVEAVLCAYQAYRGHAVWFTA
jgi:uncharacterized membrane protein YecN with MAPEG domain